MTAPTDARGRPRPAETVARDELVYKTIQDHPEGITRNSIAKLTSLQPHVVYQSLWRLKLAGQVLRSQEDGCHTWTAIPTT